MTTPNASISPPPSGGDLLTDGNDGATPKTYTEAEFREAVNRKLRGKGSEVEKLQAQLREIEDDARKKQEAVLSEQGKHKELAEAKAAEALRLASQLKEREELISTLEAERAEQLEAIASKNKERLKVLPEEHRKKLPKEDDPRKVAGYLDVIESILSEQQGAGRFGGSPRPGIRTTPEQRLEESSRIMADAMMGRRGQR